MILENFNSVKSAEKFEFEVKIITLILTKVQFLPKN